MLSITLTVEAQTNPPPTGRGYRRRDANPYTTSKQTRMRNQSTGPEKTSRNAAATTGLASHTVTGRPASQVKEVTP
jgi:hypothetical protein